jgi:quercetin dioxygenase-like cupin family protein
MHVVRADSAVRYEPPGHHGVESRRLQGLDAGGPRDYAVSVSTYAAGAEVTPLPTAADTVYVVLGGSLRVTSHDDDQTVELAVHDSVHLRAGEVRSIRNDSGAEAVLLVVLGGRS